MLDLIWLKVGLVVISLSEKCKHLAINIESFRFLDDLLINVSARWPSTAKEEGEEKWPSSSAAHISTQEAGCAVDSHQLPQHFHPCSSTTLCRVCRDRKCHNTHTYGQRYPGLLRPPSCHAELPVCAKDNWPNGLSLPHWLNMEWGDCSPPASEYWLVALLIIWLWNKQFFTPSRKCPFNACYKVLAMQHQDVLLSAA